MADSGKKAHLRVFTVIHHQDGCDVFVQGVYVANLCLFVCLCYFWEILDFVPIQIPEWQASLYGIGGILNSVAKLFWLLIN